MIAQTSWFIVPLIGMLSASPCYADELKLFCERGNRADAPRCTMNEDTWEIISVPPGGCHSAPEFINLVIDLSSREVKLLDRNGTVIWSARNASISDVAISWDELGPWVHKPSIEARFIGTISRTAGEVDLSFGHAPQEPRAAGWRWFHVKGSCRRSVSQF